MTKPSEKKAAKDSTKQTETKQHRLREREELFCQGLTQGKTQYEAYLNAGYKANNRATASALANRLLKNVKIQERLDILRAEAAERYALTPDNVLKQVGAVLNADMRNYVTWGPLGLILTPSSELTEEQLAAVESISETRTLTGGTTKFTLHSKLKAAELGAKILKMVSDKPELPGEVILRIVYDKAKPKTNENRD